MKKADYQLFKNYMLQCCEDSAHDVEHINRVLYIALDIAKHEQNVDMDVLITACLLHDIARADQNKNPSLCHAQVGATKAEAFLLEHGYHQDFAFKVAACIRAHRFRSDCPPMTIEEKILFDADKIDATGAIGIARTLLYNGSHNESIYSLDENGQVSDGTLDTIPSFNHEYQRKLSKLYQRFYTKQATAIALERQKNAIQFYENLYQETSSTYQQGIALLSATLEN